MEKDSPLVSIVLPVYNGDAFLSTALLSIENQDYPSVELIAVDDGSQDNSLEMLRAFAGRFRGSVKVLQHPAGSHRGIAATYRLALDACQGSLLAFLDQDDCWSNDKISAQVEAVAANRGVGLVFSDVYTVDDEGRSSPEPLRGFLNRPPRERAFSGLGRLLWGNFVLTFSGILVRRELVSGSDFVSEPEGYQDWILLLLLSRRCAFYHCARGKTYWRLHRSSFHGRHRRHAGHPTVDRRQRRQVMYAVKRAVAEGEHGAGGTYTWSRALLQHYWTGVAMVLHYAYVLVDPVRSFSQRRFRRAESTPNAIQ